jgi:hypothetical protein
MIKVVRPRAALEMARWILSSVAESIAEVVVRDQDVRIDRKARQCQTLPLTSEGHAFSPTSSSSLYQTFE